MNGGLVFLFLWGKYSMEYAFLITLYVESIYPYPKKTLAQLDFLSLLCSRKNTNDP